MSGSAYGLPQYVRMGAGGGEQAALQLGLQRFGELLTSIERLVESTTSRCIH